MSVTTSIKVTPYEGSSSKVVDLLGDPLVESETIIGGNVTKVTYAPEVIEVPRDLFMEVIDKLECYRDYININPGKHYASDVERTISDLKDCDVKKQNN